MSDVGDNKALSRQMIIFLSNVQRILGSISRSRLFKPCKLVIYINCKRDQFDYDLKSTEPPR